MKFYSTAGFFFSLIGLQFLTGCSSKTYPTGNYQESPVTVDGDLGEWSQPLRFSSNSGQVQYSVTNDNENVYISLQTHDDATALKILRAGVNIYFDPSAGESKKTCLAFPLPNETPGARSGNTGSTNSISGKNDMEQSLLVQALSFRASGFSGMESRLYDVSDKSRIKVAIREDLSHGIGYEAAIPITAIFGNAPVSSRAMRSLGVGIVINALKTGGGSHGSGNSQGAGGGMRGGGGHGYGGGRGMGMGGGGGGGNYHRSSSADNSEGNGNGSSTPDRTALYKSDSNWYKFRLAVKS